MSKLAWSPERDDRLRRLRAKGLSFSEIGTELGCTKSAAIARYSRLEGTPTSQDVLIPVAALGPPIGMEEDERFYEETAAASAKLLQALARSGFVSVVAFPGSVAA